MTTLEEAKKQIKKDLDFWANLISIRNPDAKIDIQAIRSAYRCGVWLGVQLLNAYLTKNQKRYTDSEFIDELERFLEETKR